MLKQLQNGSDIRGIALENEHKPVNLDITECEKIAGGFYFWLKEKLDGKNDIKIAVGMDSRLSGQTIKDAVIRTFTYLGCTVIDCGLATTPSMFMTTIFPSYDCDAALMITASHLPYYYNGIKFFTKSGGCESDDITKILKYAENSYDKMSGGDVIERNILNDYSDHLVSLIKKGIQSDENYDKPLQNFKIIVDAGNGSGGFFAAKVLEVLGADTKGSQFLDPDGNFPNHVPNPEDKDAMDSITKATIINGADLGIIFDTDVDRAAIVTRDGEEINKNALIAMMSAIVLKEQPGATIVTDSVTSTGLTDFIGNLGGVHHRFKRGYRNVIRECIRLNESGVNSPLAIETSGHGAMKENYFLDDGSYLIAKLLIEAAKLRREGKDLGSLIENLKEPKESSTYRLNIKTQNFKVYGDQVLDGLKGFIKRINGWTIEPKNYEGVRVNCNESSGNGWFLLRLSLHEPLMVLNIESDTSGGVDEIKGQLSKFLSRYDYVDTL